MKMDGADGILDALKEVESGHTHGYGERDKEHELIFEGERRANYQNVEVIANRGGRGLVHKFPKALQGTVHEKE